MTERKVMTVANIIYTLLICIGLYAFAQSQGVPDQIHTAYVSVESLK